ncbi:unnamed protein product, partial [Amoebophrya sp. A120]
LQYLLSFLAISFPSHVDHLYQLLLVAHNARKFPDAPRHGHYEHTQETFFLSCSVESEIESNLENFSDSEPCRWNYTSDSSFDSAHSRWETKKSNHEAACRQTKTSLVS